MKTKLKGLFLNTAKANCSIYESGKMCYDCLKLSALYNIDYQNIDENNRNISSNYDFYVFNYHYVTMGWLDTKYVKKLPGLKATIVLEVLPNNPFVHCPENDFDAYLVLDPTLRLPDINVYSFPRPLENIKPKHNFEEKEIPEIGTFGFATKGKGFDKVIDAVNKEFDKALIKINIPKGDYVPEETFNNIIDNLKNHPSKDEVKVIITHNFFDKEQLIEWCGQNTLNVFLYNRDMPGLSATTDQAIISGRPLAISTNSTFRHIQDYVTPYPFASLRDLIKNSQEAILKMQGDWATENFALKFQKVIEDFKVSHIQISGGPITLPKKRKKTKNKTRHYNISKYDFVPPIIFKAFRKLFRKKKILSYNTLQPFVHPSLNSFSQFNEDLLIDLLLGKKENGFYIAVGAKDPCFNSNTNRFYLRGWIGINIEPNKKAFNKVIELRPNDINLNIAISKQEGEHTFYNLSNDSTFSTLDYTSAKIVADRLNLTIATTKVKTVSLENILNQYLNSQHIDLMSIDAEGHDFSVLQSNNWDKFRPSLLLVESNHGIAQILSFMDSKDYLHIFSNLYNAIFIDKRTKNTSLLNNINWHS